MKHYITFKDNTINLKVVPKKRLNKTFLTLCLILFCAAFLFAGLFYLHSITYPLDPLNRYGLVLGLGGWGIVMGIFIKYKEVL